MPTNVPNWQTWNVERRSRVYAVNAVRQLLARPWTAEDRAAYDGKTVNEMLAMFEERYESGKVRRSRRTRRRSPGRGQGTR